MDNLSQGKGMTVQWTNDLGADVDAGDVVLLGDQGLVGVAVQDVADGESGSVLLPPGVVVKFPVKAHNGTSNAAVAVYDKVYFTSGEEFFDTDDAATMSGYALEAVASGATTTVEVLLCRA